MSSFAELRRMMVDCQLRTYDVTDRAVLAAADTVPREAFLPGELSHLAYLDRQEPLPGTGRALPAPMVTARMIQVLDLQPGEEALEYGGGSGYGAALMAEMGARTTLLEPDEAALALARTAFAQPGVVAAELVASLPKERRFDAILVSGSCETQPEPIFHHVREGGRLVVIEGAGRSARVMLYRKAGESLSGRPVFDAAAPALREFRKAEVFAL
ncbi:protein-L-isoaspartate O-methyltransferase family protein [Bosea sp. NPDC003192]|uniref:protein-L-isoaspartate O-methyltransferase family protein n=1 Tax=Bosea sp. NPDC003192 TaxID=3390551 RepID=UPI003CFDD65A